MNANAKRNRQLAAILMREIVSARTDGTRDPRAAILATELADLSAGAPDRFAQALHAYRGRPCAIEQEALQRDMETALNADPERSGRLWFLLTAREECPSPAIDEPRSRAGRRSDQPWFGPVVYVTATIVVLLVYIVFVQHEGWRLPFVKGAAFLLLSSLPGWLYLRFVHVKAAQVLNDYVLALHRLGVDKPEFLPEPPRASIFYNHWYDQGGPCYRSRSTVYMTKFEGQYGRPNRSGAGRTGAQRACVGALLPVAVVGLICSIGWAAILLDDRFLAEPSVASSADVMRFGFLGAYAFVIQMLVRRYLQQDLRPSTYVSAVVRFVLVFILTFVIASASPSTPSAVQFAVAFIVGFFPIVGLQWLRNIVSVALRRVVPSLRSAYPLSDLDGLNVWYEAQLLEVGVEDMQNLVTANLVDIILTTRVPIGRLVDWIDQAALQIRLPPSPAETPNDRGEAGRGFNAPSLRRVGIRCATDFEAVFAPAAISATDSGVADMDEMTRQLSEAIEGPVGSITIVAFLRSFAQEPNLALVRSWRADWRLGAEQTMMHEPDDPVAAAA